MCCDVRLAYFKGSLFKTVNRRYVEKLNKGKVFSTLDLVKGYFYVSVTVVTMNYTLFITYNGHFEFLRVPYGICNSSKVFTCFIFVLFKTIFR